MSAETDASELALELAMFAPALTQPGWARRASDTLRWLVAASGVDASSERRLPALVTVATVYAGLCAPRGASEHAGDVVARFTLLFFLVDDATEGELPDLLAEGASWSIGRYTGALRRWLTEFPEQARAQPKLRERFAHAYHDYLAARRTAADRAARAGPAPPPGWLECPKRALEHPSAPAPAAAPKTWSRALARRLANAAQSQPRSPAQIDSPAANSRVAADYPSFMHITRRGCRRLLGGSRLGPKPRALCLVRRLAMLLAYRTEGRWRRGGSGVDSLA